jgi:hypothetical protein
MIVNKFFKKRSLTMAEINDLKIIDTLQPLCRDKQLR